MEIKELFDYSLNLLHDPIQEGLKIYFVALTYKLVDKTNNESNKRIVPDACQRKDDSKRK
ncbi:hypothetical protein EXW38_29980 (plasmid) [Bacillus mycoides]|nr:hypothetical protein EXW38_29980 [Bacillus mycoides]